MTIQSYHPHPVFPAGLQPGFNQDHIASAQTILSAVCYNTNFFAIDYGLKGTIVTGLFGPSTPFLDPVIGPSIKFTATASNIQFPAGSPSTLKATTGTIAAIVTPGTPNSNGLPFISRSNDPSFVGSYSMGWTLNPGNLALFFDAVATFDSGIAISVGAPYFLATSFINGGTTAVFAVKRLDTGALLTSSTNTAGFTPATASGTNFSIGNLNANSFNAAAQIAAVMFSTQFLPIGILKQWSNDPWEYWYPRKRSRILIEGSTAVAPSTVKFRRSDSRIGTRIGTRQTWAV